MQLYALACVKKLFEVIKLTAPEDIYWSNDFSKSRLSKWFDLQLGLDGYLTQVLKITEIMNTYLTITFITDAI